MKTTDAIKLTAGFLLIAGLLVALGWYYWRVYSECRALGGGPFVCWHLLSKT